MAEPSGYFDIKLPSVDEDGSGIVGFGGSLEPDILLRNYSIGIFPFFEPDTTILWHCPDPRAVLTPAGFHCSRRLIRRIRSNPGICWKVNQDFQSCLRNCAKGPQRHGGVWIGDEMIEAYTLLHAAGHCHSFEVWDGDVLHGGILVIQIGAYMIGESMFSLQVDGSKMALAGLLAIMEKWSDSLLDCQFMTEHLRSLGACEMTRGEFLRRISCLICLDAPRLGAIRQGEIESLAGEKWRR